MFIDEVKKKFNVAGALQFSLNMLSFDKLVASGVKSVISMSEGEIKLRLFSGTLKISGEGLSVVAICEGDVYIKGKIGGLSFE